jgi:folate-binding protein YgfZ
VTLEDATGEMATIAIEGPQAAAILERLGAPVPDADYETRAWSGMTVARVNSTGAGGFFVSLHPAKKGDLIAAIEAEGIPEATPDDVRTVRIEHGRPRYGEEITERYLVQETALSQAVSFTKGCYLGQEIVERVRSRAQIHRVLRRVHIDMAEPPAVGSKLKSADGQADAGEIASAAFSAALGKVAAMAYVRTQLAEPATELRLGDVRVLVI